MGAVYLATDTELDRRVALKVLDVADPAGQLAARLVQEARILARLEHPGVVPIHDVGKLPDGRLFYAMKYVDGERLDHFAQSEASLPERLRVFGKICEAVAFAHSRGVLHRDLKPQNIMVGAFGEVLVLDWGVAKVLGSSESDDASPTRRDARPWRPEESALPVRRSTARCWARRATWLPSRRAARSARLDVRSDVFALGAVLRYLLVGDPAASEARTVVLGSPERLAGGSSPPLPRRLGAVVGKAMQEEADRRYADVLELAADVERFLDGRTVTALPESLWARGRRFVAKHRVAFLLILAYAVARALVLLLPGNRVPFSFW